MAIETTSDRKKLIKEELEEMKDQLVNHGPPAMVARSAEGPRITSESGQFINVDFDSTLEDIRELLTNVNTDDELEEIRNMLNILERIHCGTQNELEKERSKPVSGSPSKRSNEAPLFTKKSWKR